MNSRPAGYLLIVDKPAGQTSFDIVKRLRKLLRERKVGHTGTLDPLATGVLPICCGEATKIAGLLLSDDKAYLCTGKLGLVTDSRDLTGAVLAEHDWRQVTEEHLRAALSCFTGEIMQVPPNFSAIRQEGRRAYDRAREGEQFELPARPVVIQKIFLKRWAPPEFEIFVECGKGTYIRSLIHDLGQRLGCGAAIAELCRTRCGSFTLEQSVSLEQLVALEESAAALPIMSMEEALAHLSRVEITEEELLKVRQGQPLTRAEGSGSAAPIALLREQHLVALGEQRGPQLWPVRVLHTDI